MNIQIIPETASYLLFHSTVTLAWSVYNFEICSPDVAPSNWDAWRHAQTSKQTRRRQSRTQNARHGHGRLWSQCPAVYLNVANPARSLGHNRYTDTRSGEAENYGDVGTGVGSPPSGFFSVSPGSHRQRQPASQPGLGAGAGGGGGQRRPQPQLPKTEGVSPDSSQPRPVGHGGSR